MTTTTVDIIIPVWNNPAETRACLVSILDSTADAHLIIINNSCDRTTELMMENFCDHLGERAIYLTTERAIGFVAAVNRALHRSDADWALIVRPTGTLSAHCFQQIMAATRHEQAGIISPYCPSDHQILPKLLKDTCSCLETCEIGFSVLALSRKTRDIIGVFDEELDGGLWCLRDYRHRANAHDFRTILLPGAIAAGGSPVLFGSHERRQKMDEAALATFRKRWGVQQHVAVYLPREMDEQRLVATQELLLAAARHGHRFELFLHRRHYRFALQVGTACLHSGINLHCLSSLAPVRSLTRSMKALKSNNPQLLAVCALDGKPFPGYDAALPTITLTRLARP
jgi:hypothetical protein